MNYPLCCEKTLIDNLSSDDFDKQSEAASLLHNYIFTHKDLINFISSDSYNLKTFALLKLEKLQNQQDADLIMSCLTNNESSVRESCSFKIREFINDKEQRHFFQKKEFVPIFIAAITDINPKVCKNVSSSLKFLNDKNEIFNKLNEIINPALVEFKNYRKLQGHKYNKISFRLYWSLEALNEILPFIEAENLHNIAGIFEKISANKEYTIREKAAILICTAEKLNLPDEARKIIADLKQKLSNDENFYVKLAINPIK